MFAQDVTLGRNDQPVRIDPQADWPICEGCEGTVAPVGPRKPVARNAVAIAFKADQTSGRDALAQLDEAVKGDRQWHQRYLFLGPDIGDRARLFAMGCLSPQREATLFQPGIQCGQIWEVRHPLQHLVAGISNVLLDLPPSPAVSNRWRLAGSTQPAAGLQNSGS